MSAVKIDLLLCHADTFVAVRFTNAFHLLLPGKINGERFATSRSSYGLFGVLLDGLVGAYSIMLGGFDQDVFRDAPSPGVAVSLFVLFTLVGSVVMLNAVIALMVRDDFPLHESLSRLLPSHALGCFRARPSPACTRASIQPTAWNEQS